MQRTELTRSIERGRPSRCWPLLAAVAMTMTQFMANASAADDGEGLRPNWKWIATIPEVRIQGQFVSGESRLKLWTENDWLLVRRTTAEDDFEWQVVLARSSDPSRPEIKIDEASGALHIRYREFFIREGVQGRLRVYREPKTAESPEWPLLKLGAAAKSFATGGGGPFDRPVTRLRIWEEDYWTWAESGPAPGRPDIWLRLCTLAQTSRLGEANPRSRGGVIITRGGPVEANSGPVRVIEDGDLFITNRVTIDIAGRGLRNKILHDVLGTEEPPELVGKSWINDKAALPIGKLQGRVVLLGFWAVWSEQSVKRLTRLEALHKKYSPDGLVVIGVHPTKSSDDAVKEVEAQRVTFPVMIDADVEPVAAGRPALQPVPTYAPGQTIQKYRTDVSPMYFLIDKAGKLAWGFGLAPPTDSQIVELLK